MRRRLIILFCCLVAGAAVNTGVAWSCALWSGSQIPEVEMVEFDPKRHCWHAEHADIVGGVDRIYEIDETRSFGRSLGAAVGKTFIIRNATTYVFDVVTERSELLELEHLRAGWPCLAFEGGCGRVSHGKNASPPYQYANAIELAADASHSLLTKKFPRMVPLAPIWSGFIVNTLFYAALIWCLSAGPFVVRRTVRKRRGRCLHCAYPIGEGDVCTECGKARTGVSPTAGGL